MFDAVRNNKRIVQGFLALITLPFAFFGVESYVRNVDNDGKVAKIGEMTITQQQFQQALREQQERLRASMGGQLDPAIFNTPEARKAVLNDLIDQRLLFLEAAKQRLMVGDQALAQVIGGIDAFKVEGRFSKERYEAALQAQGMNSQMFESQLRQDLTLQQLLNAVGRSGMLSKTVADRLADLQTEKREVQEIRILPDAYLDKVRLVEGAAQQYYEAQAKRFELPEQAKVEYVVLTLDHVAAQNVVTEAEIKTWYDGHQDRFMQPEERRASHILITPEGSDKGKAKFQAETLLQEVRKTPAAFADLAKKHSKDPGSAAKGGDLGFFGRGMMVKSFEEAVYSMKEGEVSAVVESDFGFHIIKLTAIRPAKVKPFSEVRAQIEAELQKSSASRKFAEAAETFSNMVYEQSDSLKPVADKFKLAVKQSDWLLRKPVAVNGPLGNEKLLAAIFAEDSVKNKRNTEAVDVSQNTLVAARVLDYKPATRQTFESVRAGIESLLKRQEAVAMAKKDGEAKLQALKQGDDKLAWGAAKSVTRLDPRALPQPALAPVFKLEATKLPAYTGVELPEAGYALYKLVKVGTGEKLDEARRNAMLGQLSNLSAQDDAQNYLAALRGRYKVEINQAALENKEK